MSSAGLRRGRGHRQPCVVPDIKGDAPGMSPLSVMVAVLDGLYQVREAHSALCFLRFYSEITVSILSHDFPPSSEMLI